MYYGKSFLKGSRLISLCFAVFIGQISPLISKSQNPLNFSSNEVENLIYRAKELVNKYQYSEAIKVLDSLSIDGLQDSIVAVSHYLRGECYMYLDRRDNSLKSFHEALRIFKDTKNLKMKLYTLDKIADNHNYMGEHNLARYYYDQALALKDSVSDNEKQANILGNIGGMFKEEGNYDSASYFYLLSLNFLEGLRNRQLIDAYSGIATVNEKIGNTTLALDYHHKALNESQYLNDILGLGFSNQHLGYYYFRKGQIDSATYYMLKANTIGKQIQNNQLVKNSAFILQDIYHTKNYNKAAYEFLKEYTAIDDSLFNEKTFAAITKTQIEYERAKIAAENELLRNEALLANELSKNTQSANMILIVSIIGMSLLLVSLYFLYDQRRKRQKQMQLDNALIRKQSQKLEEINSYKSRFFANISHDLRTPITLIQGYLELLKMEPNTLTDLSKKSIDYIKESVDRLNHMTEEIRELIKLEERRIHLKYNRIRIKAFLGMIAEMLDKEAQNRGLVLSYTPLTDDDPIIHADKYGLEKILFNLLENALKYNTTGKKLAIVFQSTAKGVIIQISDDGPGIAADKIERIFERYFQNKENWHAKIEGQGIGLSVVKEFVELHGGNITVKSNPNIQTVFSVELPYNLDKPTLNDRIVGNIRDDQMIKNLEIRKLKIQRESPERNKLSQPEEEHILIVDDHPEIRSMLRSFLETKYSILEASNGEEALYILKSSTSVNLIITDLMMPVLNGYRFIEKIDQNKDYKRIPVLILSAFVDDPVKVEFISRKNCSWLNKPIQRDVLHSEVEKLLKLNEK